MIIRFFTSVRLTLGLLLALASIAVVGTIWPSRETELDVFRYELYYQSPWYRLILLLLALNLIACTLQLIHRRWQEKSRLLAQLSSTAPPAAEARCVGNSLEQVADALRECGYHVCADAGRLLGRKGLPSRWGVIVVHLSVLLIMAGSLASSLGFVGTLSVYEGDTQGTVFDWQAQADTDLGFALRLDDFEPVFYPIELQFAVIDPADNRQVAAISTRVGETVALPMSGYRAQVLAFDPFIQRIDFAILAPDGGEHPYTCQSGVREPDNTVAGMVLYPLAYRDPIIKQQRSRVTVFSAGRELGRGVIEVNRPLQVEGYTIYQIAYGRDDQGYFYSGFQISRDPGSNLVWAGCICLMLGLLMNFCFVYRVVGAHQDGDVTALFILAGFRNQVRAEGLGRLCRQAGLVQDPPADPRS